MFERFGDLPLHVLVIHAAIVLLPTAALVAIVFAVRPGWRWLLRWPVLLLALGAAATAFLARQSGLAFVTAKPALAQLVAVHKSRGNLLFYFTLGFAAVAILAFLWLTGPTALASGRGAKTRQATSINRLLDLAVSAGLFVMAVLVAWQTYRTGDSGARAVWEGTLPK
ncbi:MAG TPA: DUF2231 domain-containing protein [Kribbellaceae bacterium]|nr:DUF2231 domain-containing protein [Kribbellaceae bacterium]